MYEYSYFDYIVCHVHMEIVKLLINHGIENSDQRITEKNE